MVLKLLVIIRRVVQPLHHSNNVLTICFYLDSKNHFLYENITDDDSNKREKLVFKAGSEEE